jgi:histidine triad (HIT) family protein
MVSENSYTGLIYEDEKLFVIPTLEPVNKGHILVIPKVHAPYLADLDEDTLMHIMRIARRCAEAIRKSSYKCEGVNIFVADGEAAGQEVFHFHLHVYPRFKNDGWGFKYDKKRNLVTSYKEEREEIGKEIKRYFNV